VNIIVRLEAFDFSNLHYKVHRYRRKCFLPAFAESPVWKGGDECEKGIHRSLGEGGSAWAGFAEDVKMPRAAAWGASHLMRLIAERAGIR
jgi:hypothetical protein